MRTYDMAGTPTLVTLPSLPMVVDDVRSTRRSALEGSPQSARFHGQRTCASCLQQASAYRLARDFDADDASAYELFQVHLEGLHAVGVHTALHHFFEWEVVLGTA
jgi:hypothetical protein